MTCDGAGGERPTFLGRSVPAAFDVRTVAIPAGGSLPYDEAEWLDAIVVLERGELEVECVRGGRRRFERGAVMCLAGLALRTLHNLGPDPALLVAVSRRTQLAALARRILDTNAYMTLGTADGDGRPWASPVFYAADGYAELFWVSSPDARHSRNISARPEVGIVVFDSRAPVGGVQAVYIEGVAGELAGEEADRGVEVFSGGSVAWGARVWTPDDVRPPARHRLYRATATEHFVLDPEGDRAHAVRVQTSIATAGSAGR
jgi:uncharacterized protein YhbP (UPF0306 family)